VVINETKTSADSSNNANINSKSYNLHNSVAQLEYISAECHMSRKCLQ